jgi:hypothetical protein
LFVVHCAFSFGEKNGELYQLTTSLRKLHLLSETAFDKELLQNKNFTDSTAHK